MDTEETVPEIIKVKCLTKAYYRNQMREKDSIILYFTEDMDKSVFKTGPNIGKPKPGMPRYFKVMPPDTPLTLRDGEEAEDVTTLSQMSSKGTPAQQKAAQKVKDDQVKLDAERAQFEKDKAEFEASKNPQGKMESHKEPKDGEEVKVFEDKDTKEEKDAFEASKNPAGENAKEPDGSHEGGLKALEGKDLTVIEDDGKVYTNPAKAETAKLKKKWRGTTKNSKKK